MCVNVAHEHSVIDRETTCTYILSVLEEKKFLTNKTKLIIIFLRDTRIALRMWLGTADKTLPNTVKFVFTSVVS